MRLSDVRMVRKSIEIHNKIQLNNGYKLELYDIEGKFEKIGSFYETLKKNLIRLLIVGVVVQVITNIIIGDSLFQMIFNIAMFGSIALCVLMVIGMRQKEVKDAILSLNVENSVKVNSDKSLLKNDYYIADILTEYKEMNSWMEHSIDDLSPDEDDIAIRKFMNKIGVSAIITLVFAFIVIMLKHNNVNLILLFSLIQIYMSKRILEIDDNVKATFKYYFKIECDSYEENLKRIEALKENVRLDDYKYMYNSFEKILYLMVDIYEESDDVIQKNISLYTLSSYLEDINDDVENINNTEFKNIIIDELSKIVETFDDDYYSCDELEVYIGRIYSKLKELEKKAGKKISDLNLKSYDTDIDLLEKYRTLCVY